MTIIKPIIKTQSVKAEVRQLRAAARKVTVSKARARQFLVATGMYTVHGALKPQYR